MFSEKVRRLREELGWTQQKLADELGCSLRTISSYERENKRPRHRRTYSKLAEIFGVDVIGLFAGGTMSLEDKKAALDAIEEAYYMAKSEMGKEK